MTGDDIAAALDVCLNTRSGSDTTKFGPTATSLKRVGGGAA